MKGRVGTLVVVVVILAIPLLYLAFRPHAAFQPTTSGEKAAIDVMESDLMALARQESFYYRTHGRFTPYPESTYFMSSLGVSAPQVTLRDSGYYATVTGRLRGVKCAIAVGTANPVDKSAKETIPACK